VIRGILFTSEAPRHHLRGRWQESAPIPTVLRLSASNLIRGGSSRPWSGSDGASSAGASRPSGATTLPRRNTSRQGGRDWRKLHPRVAERGSIAARCSTDIPVDETSFFPHPPGQASDEVERQTVDSAYDNTTVHDLPAGRGSPVVAAPKKNAHVSRSGPLGHTRETHERRKARERSARVSRLRSRVDRRARQSGCQKLLSAVSPAC